MSTQENQDEPEGLSKYIKRMRTVLKRGSTKSSSISSMKDITGEASTSNAGPTKAPFGNVEVPIEPHPNPEEYPTKIQEPTVISHWSAVQQAKAQALFAKYGLTLEPGEWKSPSDMTVQRVTKPIRMRVRRTCHRCQTTFGPNKVCVNCQHTRCKKCPRHPAPKSKPVTEPEQGAVRALLEEKKARDARLAELPRRTQKAELTIPSRSGGQDLVRRPVRQRVRRICHECESLFPTEDATECINCGHIRCKICPRDPPKLRKYPDGYPGDAEPPIEIPQRTWRKPRQRVRYTCHVCTTLYRAGERNCSNCGQERGPSTIRDPPKKIRPEFDPEVVMRVQERLAQMNIGA
ncbi:uncharacterized protein ACHE_41110S [Aspergillus chevalieri]|uniref:Uncharacterized protein n=1 Tax=Aspergillus chevalieri TaxID=182096 RepID=A0A7R7VPP3_ASPCH|nr:uncharacterized protein ACHE_41110S [Aspergillus chevalieri]BCR88546.1 hypothetical protein ACHE_41110S [Aspergillus chevalieri]